MADSTTTGSAIVGTVNGGLQNGLFGSNGSPIMCSNIMTIYGSPQNVVTASVGSQIVFDIENNDVYISIAQNGSSWNRVGSMT